MEGVNPGVVWASNRRGLGRRNSLRFYAEDPAENPPRTAE